MHYTEKQLAALRAGAKLADVKAMVPETTDEQEVELSAEELKQQNSDLMEQYDTAATEIQTLKATNEGLTSQLAEATGKQAETDATVVELKADVEKMTPAIMGMIQQRALVLGATVPSTYENTEAMLADYEKLEVAFSEKFKAGRQSMPTKKVDEKTERKGFDSRTLAEMKAIKLPA